MTAPHRLIGVDLIRIASALLVAWFHLAFWSWAGLSGTTYAVMRGAVSYRELEAYSSPGWVGVQIFFVLSGFVIAYSAQNVSASRFALRRFLRLFPAALICASITLAVALAISLSSPGALVYAYVHTVLFHPYGPFMDGVYWTLSVEISFYLVVFFIILLGFLDRLELVLILTGSAVSMAWIAYAVAHGPGNPFLHFVSERTGDLLLLGHAMYFSIGGIIYYAWREGWNSSRSLIAALCVAASLIAIASNANVKVTQDYVSSAVVWLAAVAMLVILTRYDEQISASFGRTSALVRLLGLATYPFYLLHNIVGAAVLRNLVGIGVNRFAALAWSFIVIGLFSVLVTMWAETRLRTLLLRILGSASVAFSSVASQSGIRRRIFGERTAASVIGNRTD